MIRYLSHWCSFCRRVTDWLHNDGVYLHCSVCKCGELMAKVERK